MDNFKKLFHGVYDFLEQDDGYTNFSKFSETQRKYLKFNEFFYVRTTFDASITIEFTTEATEFGFDYKFFNIATSDTFDLYIDDKPFCIRKVEELSYEGKICFTLNGGKKKVTLYFPIDADVAIRNFYANDVCIPVEKGKKVLFIGDSITQGYGAFESGATFVNVVDRILGYELLNQGIGGYYFDKNSLERLDKFVPEEVFIAMGTNLCCVDDKEKYIAEFFEKLPCIYANVPITVITPIWRNDFSDAYKKVCEVSDLIEKFSQGIENIKIIYGDKMIPHDEKYFLDKLHPNAEGAIIFGENLAKAILQK